MRIVHATMRHVGSWTIGAICTAAATVGPVSAQGLPPETQPSQAKPAESAVSITTSDQQRLNDLISLVEGQHSAQVRRTGARELLRQGWPETAPRLTAILRGPDRAAKTAVALALSDLSSPVVGDYTEPLIGLLSDVQPDVRHAAAAALARSRDDDLVPRLKSLLLDDDQPIAARLAATETLGMMPRRDAIAVLAEALQQRASPIAAPALAALEQATAHSFHGDPEAALRWWGRLRDATPADWQRWQIERLVRENRAQGQRIRSLEQRLASALREGYLCTPEGQRPALLDAYLTDTSAEVRRLGLALVQSKLAEGKELVPETAARTRELLTAPEPAVRASAVRTVATLRDPQDAEYFERLLVSEKHEAVREALVNGLGYVGSASAVAPLLELLESADRQIASEVVTGLGRLSERGVLDGPTRAAVASALLIRTRAAPREDHAIRERLLWAMSRVGDPCFGAEFVAALDTPEAATVRLAAVRGIAVLADPKTAKANGQASQPASHAAGGAASGNHLSPGELVDALASATGDPDAGVRRATVEALAQLATSDPHVEALWSRLSPDREPEEGIRVTAWRGALRVIAGRPASGIRDWLDRLPGDEAAQRQRAVELLQAAEKELDSRPEARGELGWVRAQLALRRAAMGQTEQSISMYLTALEDLDAAKSSEMASVALELLRLTLLNDRYDEQIAAALTQCNPTLDGEALWEAVRGEIEQRLQPDEVDRAIAMLVALQTHPPASMPAAAQQALEQTLGRARQLRIETDAALVQDGLRILREKPDDEPTRQTITQLGARALPALRDALRAALEAEQPDPDQVQRLHDLVKAVAPDWPGFPPDAATEQKLESLDLIDTQT